MAEFNRELLLARFMAKAVFFSSVLFSQCRLVVSEEYPTAATDGKTIWLNPNYFATLSLNKQVAGLAHEVGHVIFLHCQQLRAWTEAGHSPDGKPMDGDKHNQATDYVINDLLKECGFELDPGWLHDTKYPHTLGSAEVYRRLPDGGQGGQGGQGGHDTHIPAPDNAMGVGQETQMAAAVANAARAAKAAGQLPSALGELVGEILNPKVPWQEVLRREICYAHKTENTWARPNRRRLAVNPVVMPGRRSHSCGEIAVVIDTSGSISREEARRFLGEVKSICQDAHPEKVHILWTDTRVARHDELEDPDDIEGIIERCKCERLPGGGGTDMPVAFEFLRTQGIDPSACIIFTDGHTPFGVQQKYQVVWAISTDQKAPWGITVKVD